MCFKLKIHLISKTVAFFTTKVQISETRNSSVAEIGERYHLNHAIIVQAACQAVVFGTVCLQAACSWNMPQLTS